MPSAKGSRGKKLNDTPPADVVEEVSDDDGRPRGYWYRSELAGKIPRRFRKTRVAALLLFGATKAVGTGSVAAVAATTRGGKRVARATRDRTRDGRTARRWMVEDVTVNATADAPNLNHHHRKMFGGRGFYCSPCNTRYSTVSLLNDHFLIVHGDEKSSAVVREPVAAERVIHRSPSTGRTRVKRMDQPRPIKRHAQGPQTKRSDYATAVVEKYRKQINITGARVMSSDPIAQRIRSAAVSFGEQKPRGRTEMFEQVAGMIAAIEAIREGAEVYSHGLRRPYRDRTEIAGILVRPHFKRFDEGAEQMIASLMTFVATFEDVNSLAIRVAKGELPNGGATFLSK